MVAEGVNGVSDRKFHGCDSVGIFRIYKKMTEIEDSLALSEDEVKTFDIAVQCVAQIYSRMLDGKEIIWDD